MEGNRPTDARASEIVDGLAVIEDRLDPRPARRGQRVADLLTVAVVAVLTLVFDLELRYPLLLIGVLVAARMSGRGLRRIRDRPLQRDRERLLASVEEDPGSAEPDGSSPAN